MLIRSSYKKRNREIKYIRVYDKLLSLFPPTEWVEGRKCERKKGQTLESRETHLRVFPALGYFRCCNLYKGFLARGRPFSYLFSFSSSSSSSYSFFFHFHPSSLLVCAVCLRERMTLFPFFPIGPTYYLNLLWAFWLCSVVLHRVGSSKPSWVRAWETSFSPPPHGANDARDFIFLFFLLLWVGYY